MLGDQDCDAGACTLTNLISETQTLIAAIRANGYSKVIMGTVLPLQSTINNNDPNDTIKQFNIWARGQKQNSTNSASGEYLDGVAGLVSSIAPDPYNYYQWMDAMVPID